jgi:hypothetical protein
MPELDISAEKVAWIIVRARELEGKVAPFMNDSEAVDEQGGGILENRSRDTTERELRGFLAALNQDELANLVALSWLGRGTYDLDDWDRALATAKSERTNSTANYLLQTPDVADHLEAGLEAFGIRAAGLEENVD